MRYRLYAMDTCFRTPQGLYPFDVRCEMTAELGFDATYLTAGTDEKWADVPRLAHARSKYGLDVSAVYVMLDLNLGQDHPANRRIENLFHTLDGCRNIEVAIRTAASDAKLSDPAHDATAARWLEHYLPVCESRGLNLLLYPHINFWMQRIDDAVRLCRLIQHPRLGAVFCGFHWYAVDAGNVFATLDAATAELRQVNLSGSRLDPDGLANKATIEPLDCGDLDNFAILAHLRRMNYQGMIGVQGYSIGGDVYGNLKRSITAFREWETRLDAHPNWGNTLI